MTDLGVHIGVGRMSEPVTCPPDGRSFNDFVEARELHPMMLRRPRLS